MKKRKWIKRGIVASLKGRKINNPVKNEKNMRRGKIKINNNNDDELERREDLALRTVLIGKSFSSLLCRISQSVIQSVTHALTHLNTQTLQSVKQ